MTMTLLPVVLCLLSAVTVAATNMFVKRGGDVLTARAYKEIRRRFGAEEAVEELTVEERKRNAVRARAHAAEGGRYG